MKRLFIGAIALVSVTGMSFGTVAIARANDPEYQMKKNDKVISEIIEKVTNSSTCKATKEPGFMKDGITFFKEAEIATACMKLFNNQFEYIIKIQKATSNKERKEYKKSSDLLFVTSTRHEK